jgi:hypothetical protein
MINDYQSNFRKIAIHFHNDNFTKQYFKWINLQAMTNTRLIFTAWDQTAGTAGQTLPVQLPYCCQVSHYLEQLFTCKAAYFCQVSPFLEQLLRTYRYSSVLLSGDSLPGTAVQSLPARLRTTV